MMASSHAALDDLAARCLAHGIRLEVPLSQLEAEAVRRDTDLPTVLTRYLVAKLEEAAGAP